MKFSSPLIALEFLTPLRLRTVRQWGDRTFAQAMAWYPAVGLLMGGLLLLVDRGLERLLPVGPTAAIEVALLALISGGLHLDGVADTADGMAVQGDQARRLGVMSEGRTGPAGVMALVIVLLILWSALASLAPPVRAAGLVLAPAIARWSVIPVVVLFAPARPRGLGHALHEAAFPFAAPISTLIVAATAFAFFGPPGLVLIAVAFVVAVVIAGAASRLLYGVTGDTYGAVIEATQAAVLLAVVAAGTRGWLEPTFLR